MGSEEAVRKLEGHPELRRVLWACYEYWRGESMPEEERSICYSWVIEPFRQRFGGSFHPSKLRQLARLGFLEPEEASRGGKRRYYRLTDPKQIEEALRRFGLIP